MQDISLKHCLLHVGAYVHIWNANKNDLTLMRVKGKNCLPLSYYKGLVRVSVPEWVKLTGMVSVPEWG